MLLEVLGGLGGVAWLKDQAQQDPRAFLTLIGKVLPLQQRASKDEGVIVEIVSFGPEPEAEAECGGEHDETEAS